MVIRKDAYHCNKHRGLRFSVTFVNGHIEVIYLGMVQCFNSTLVMAWLLCRDCIMPLGSFKSTSVYLAER